jgi:hypothetical protein
MIVFCAFTFDPEAAKDIDALKGITALKAQMNTDLLTEDLKKARASNQSFWLMGQPDVHADATARRPVAGGGEWLRLLRHRQGRAGVGRQEQDRGLERWTPTTTGAACSRTRCSSRWRARTKAG